MTTRERLSAPLRRDQIVEVALALSARPGYTWQSVTRDQIGRECCITGQAVMHHFNTIAQLRRSIMRAAVRRENLAVIAQGLAAGDGQARKAGPDLRRRALGSLV
jgi:hypothetical protein